jgi:hypothetical protein
MTQERLFPMKQISETSDDYFTPKWLFDALGVEFDLDVCCPPEGPLHTPCKAFYTQETDGLASLWSGMVWMNPPFSGTTPWIDKWIDHANGICLVPFSRARWFSRLWESDAVMVHPTPSHTMFNFIHKGKETNIYMPVVLAAIGAGTDARLDLVGKVR